MNSRNTSKMVEHILFATVRTLWTLVALALLIKLFRILLKRKYIQDQNYTILAAIWWKRSYFVENVSTRSPGWTVPAYGKIFIPVTEIDIGNRASPAPNMNTSIFLQRKEWRGEISKVVRVHMRRPLELPYCTITNDLAMDFGLSVTGQNINTCCPPWGEGLHFGPVR